MPPRWSRLRRGFQARVPWSVVPAATRSHPLAVSAALLAEFVAGLAVAHAAGADRRRELRASSEKLGKLAEQQAALRRVATLVARGVDPSQLFNAVANEIADYLHAIARR